MSENAAKRTTAVAKNRFASSVDLPWIEFRRTDRNSATYKDHFHSDLFIGAVTAGHTDVAVGGQSYRAQQGSLVIIGPHVVHRCSPALLAHSYIVAYIDPDWCLSLQKEVFGPMPELQLPRHPLIDDKILFRRFIQLVELLESPGFALEKSEHLARFIVALLSRHTDEPQQQQPSAPNNFVTTVKKLLAAPFEEQLTLNEIAEQVGYNPYYLLRHFKKKVGLTPHEYRLNMRIEHAKYMLRNGTPPADVAAATGFVDQSHLHRTFRQFVAATPGEYQRRLSR